MSSETLKHDGARGFPAIARTGNQSAIIVSPAIEKTISLVIDADAEQIKRLQLEQDALMDQLREFREQHEITVEKLWVRYLEISQEIKRLGEKPACYGKLGSELEKTGAPVRCEACVHIQTCYQAERGRS